MKKTYFLLAPGERLVKIGESSMPMRRMQALRLMNATTVEALCVVADSERGLHTKFAESRRHGEWFSITPEIVQYLQENKHEVAAERLEKLCQRNK